MIEPTKMLTWLNYKEIIEAKAGMPLGEKNRTGLLLEVYEPEPENNSFNFKASLLTHLKS